MTPTEQIITNEAIAHVIMRVALMFNALHGTFNSHKYEKAYKRDIDPSLSVSKGTDTDAIRVELDLNELSCWFNLLISEAILTLTKVILGSMDAVVVLLKHLVTPHRDFGFIILAPMFQFTWSMSGMKENCPDNSIQCNTPSIIIYSLQSWTIKLG